MRNGSAAEKSALVIYGVMGAGLFGAGLILIVAHSWDDLSRAVRGGLSIGLLLVAMTIPYVGWVHAKHKRNLRTILLDWAAALTISTGLGIVILNSLSGRDYIALLFGQFQLKPRTPKTNAAPLKLSEAVSGILERETGFEPAFPSRSSTSHTRCSPGAPPQLGNVTGAAKLLWFSSYEWK